MLPMRGRLLLLASLLLAGFGQAEPAAEPLPTGALLQLGTTQLRHPYKNAPNVPAAYSPDGKVLASRGDDNAIRLWDSKTGKLLHVLPDLKGGITAFAFAANGQTLASGGFGLLRLWDVASGKQIRQWEAHAKEIVTLAFSPDGQHVLSGSPDKTVRLWDAGTGKELKQFGEQLDPIVSVAYAANGKLVAAGGRRSTVHIWDAASGKELFKLKSDGSRLCAIAFSPDSQILAMGSRTIVRLWDVNTGNELRQCGQAISDDVTSHNNDETLAFSPNGELLATGGKSIRLWEVASGKEIRAFGEAGKRVSSVSFGADGKTLASTGGDQEIRLWDPATGKPIHPTAGHQDRVLCVACSPGGKIIATGGQDKVIYLWDAVTGRVTQRLTGHINGVCAVAFAANGKVLASADTGGALRVWDDAGKELAQLQGHSDRVNALALSPDGKKLASAGRDGKLRCYDVYREKELHEFPAHAGEATAVAFSLDGKLLASGAGDGTIHVWDVLTGEPVQKPVVDPDEDDGMIRVLMQQPAAPMRSPVLLLAFTPSGKHISYWLDSGALGLREVGTAKQLRQFDGPPAGGSSAAFSPDGRTLACRDRDNRISLREVATGNERRPLHGHANLEYLSAVAFCGDGRRLVSVSDDTTALVWDVTGRLRDGQLTSLRLTAKELDQTWSDLANEDATKAFQGIWNMVAGAADALPYLQERLKPMTVDPKRVEQLIADLDSNQFAVREKARLDLEELAELAETALKKALADKPALEVVGRLEKLLAKVAKERYALNPHRLRVLRVIETLEQVGSPEAKKLLESIVAAPAELRLTDEVKHEAKASLQRLARRP